MGKFNLNRQPSPRPQVLLEQCGWHVARAMTPMWRWRTKHMISFIGQTSPSTVQSVKTHVKLPFSKAHSPTILINISLFRCWTMYNPKLIMKSRGLINVFKIYSTQKDRTNLSRLVVRWCVSPTNCRISSFSHWFWGVATLPIQFSGRRWGATWPIPCSSRWSATCCGRSPRGVRRGPGRWVRRWLAWWRPLWRLLQLGLV